MNPFIDMVRFTPNEKRYYRNSIAPGLAIIVGCSPWPAGMRAREGIGDLRRSAINKVKAGLISLAEMNRVTKD